MRAGTRAYGEGNFAEALARYQNAYRLSSRPELLYNIALCHDRLEHKQEAVTQYQRFLAALPDAPRAAIARSRLHILQASLGAATDEADSSPDEAHPDVVDVDAASEPTADSGERSPSRSVLGPAIAFGVGGAGLVTFVVGAIITRGRYGDAKDTCDAGACDQGAIHDVNTSAHIADVGLGVAVTGAAVGVVLLLVSRDDDGEHAHVTPTVGPNAAGLTLRGRF